MNCFSPCTVDTEVAVLSLVPNTKIARRRCDESHPVRHHWRDDQGMSGKKIPDQISIISLHRFEFKQFRKLLKNCHKTTITILPIESIKISYCVFTFILSGIIDAVLADMSGNGDNVIAACTFSTEATLFECSGVVTCDPNLGERLDACTGGTPWHGALLKGNPLANGKVKAWTWKCQGWIFCRKKMKKSSTSVVCFRRKSDGNNQKTSAKYRTQMQQCQLRHASERGVANKSVWYWWLQLPSSVLLLTVIVCPELGFTASYD